MNLLVLALCFIVSFGLVGGVDTNQLGETKKCTEGAQCEVDGYVGTGVIYEDEQVRVWNFTLSPGEMTSMHSHDYDYHFVAIKPTQLEVYGVDGSRLFDFRAEGVLGFKLVGEFLEPIGIELPWPVPRVHAAKNIGDDDYYEILFESKKSGGGLDPAKLNTIVQEQVGEL
mmetsp:Transcript_14908/g.41209  ORF Transcript_14908/g.41209 Transcript_14908/m.41209 type:complete len:170 (-) Transcript_14908:15-524(-)